MSKSYFFRQKSALILSDSMATIIAMFFAYMIRFKTIIPNVEENLEWPYLKITLILIGFNLFFLEREKAYKWHRPVFYWKPFLYALIASILIFYFFKDNKVSRFTILLYFVLVLVMSNFLRYLVRVKMPSISILVFGKSKQVDNYLREFNKSQITYANDFEDLKKIVLTENHPQLLIAAIDDDFKKTSDQILQISNISNIEVQIVPSFTLDVLKSEISDDLGYPILTVNTHSLGWIGSTCKRLFDVLFSLLVLILGSPVFFMVGLLVKLTSEGPVFYGQERMGLDGEVFKTWKFRSMKIDAEKETGAVWAKENDPRITPIGSFLRRTSLDEIPQFWNVLIGQMSIVGPRPERPELIGKFRHEIPAYMLRHRMKAGITGWAQINGLRGNCDLGERIQADLYYIKNWSFWLDIQIIWLTVYREIIKKVL